MTEDNRIVIPETPTIQAKASFTPVSGITTLIHSKGDPSLLGMGNISIYVKNIAQKEIKVIDYTTEFHHHPRSFPPDVEVKESALMSAMETVMHYYTESVSADNLPPKIYIWYTNSRSSFFWKKLFTSQLDDGVPVIFSNEKTADGETQAKFYKKNGFGSYYTTDFIIHPDNPECYGIFFCQKGYDTYPAAIDQEAAKYSILNERMVLDWYAGKEMFRSPTPQELLTNIVAKTCLDTERQQQALSSMGAMIDKRQQHLRSAIAQMEQHETDLRLSIEAQKRLEEQIKKAEETSNVDELLVTYDEKIANQLFEEIEIIPQDEGGSNPYFSLKIITHPIVLDQGRVTLGQFEVNSTIYPHNTYEIISNPDSDSEFMATSVHTYKNNRSSRDSSYIHPHVSNSGGSMCQGDLPATAANCLIKGDLTELLMALFTALSTYNGNSPYCAIENWDSDTDVVDIASNE